MLYNFLIEHREEIVARTRAKVAARRAPRASEEQIANGPQLFLSQLIAMRLAEVSGGAMDTSAPAHGGDLLRMGYTVGQVVHDYGNVCQAITELADELHAPITADEFHTLNRCLDNAIAGAVTEYMRLRERSITAEGTERLAVLAHDMRNRLSAATLAFEMLKVGTIGVSGSTAAILGRNLRALRELIDHSFTDVRLQVGIEKRERIHLHEVIEEIEVDTSFEASAREIELSIAPVDRGLEVEVDKGLLTAAIAHLMQSALTFTRPHGRVSLDVIAGESRVLIEIRDERADLPPGTLEEMFHSQVPGGGEHANLGHGLTISRKGVEANGGVIHVRNQPGSGCVFSIELPRR